MRQPQIPTCLLYDERGQVKLGFRSKKGEPDAWNDALRMVQIVLGPFCVAGWIISGSQAALLTSKGFACDSFLVDSILTVRQPQKEAIDVIIDFLSCLWEYAKEQITRDIGAVADLST
jgi:hypothetical protein